jgi:RNA polymerase sigma factor (sigma-70 family)
LDPAFEALYREHYAFVWRCARRMGTPAADLDDVLQDTFTTAYRRFSSYDPQVRASTWLFGILRNVQRNRSRGEHRHRRRLAALAEQQPHTPLRCMAEQVLAQARLHEFLRGLDEDKRAVFVLAELEGLSAKEIAESLVISPNTASSRLRLARKLFAEQFGVGLSRSELGAATAKLREQAEQPPEHARQRTHALLLVGLDGSRWGGAGTLAGQLGLTKLAATVLTAGSVLGLGAVLVGATQPAETARASMGQMAGVEPSGDEESLTEPGSDTPPEPAADDDVDELEADPLEADIAIVAAPARASTKLHRPDRRAAYERIRQARELLVADQPEQALKLLDAASPPAELRGTHVTSLVAVLCRLGDHERARDEVAGLRAIEPDSPLLDRIDHACW